MKTPVFAFILSLLAATAHGNQERAVPFTRLRIEADAVKGAGNVSAEIVQDEKGKIVSLKITAFAKNITVSDEHLARLSGKNLHGVRLLYSEGFFGSSVLIAFRDGAAATNSEEMVKVSPSGAVSIVGFTY